jgi:hypothetical protein
VLSEPSPDVAVQEIGYSHGGGRLKMVMEENEAIELVRQPSIKALKDPPTTLSSTSRFPVLVLLMDTNKKAYEILRIYIDDETDCVWDVLKSVRKNLPNSWRQDYDGLIQMRSGKPSQLIHCLSIQHYDVQPFECLVAKPWSMAAKMAGWNGQSLIDHLKHVGVLVDTKAEEANDVIVKLSETAAARVHEPDGPLDHYHAKHYLSFLPPFESPPKCSEHRSSQSVRSVPSRRSVGSSNDPRLQSLQEEAGDDKSFFDDSHEVQTVSSYSYLSSIDPFPSSTPPDSTSTVGVEEAKLEKLTFISHSHDEGDSRLEMPTAPTPVSSSPQVIPETQATLRRSHTLAVQEDSEEKQQSPNIKGLVGKLLGRSSTMRDEPLAHATTATWDLSPMNNGDSIFNFSASDMRSVGSHSSKQPLLLSI